MPESYPTWVGLLDFDGGTPVIPMAGPVTNHHRKARVLVRLHGAPIGYVLVDAHPAETLTDRVHAEADANLKEPLRLHADWEFQAIERKETQEWLGRVACPSIYPSAKLDGVSIIVCTRDRPDFLRECLAALRQVTHAHVEILVVDNAPSGPATRELVSAMSREDSRIRYTCEPRPGLSRARNHGVSEAAFDIIAFTDDDTLADPGWATAIAAGFAADSEAACVTGLVTANSLDTASERYFDARYQWGEAFEPRRYDLGSYRPPAPLYPFTTGIFGTGANFAMRRAALARLGSFDPILGAGGPGRGGEDSDMFLRVILAGERICYVPSALVWHRHRPDISSLGEQVYSYGYGLGAYLSKHLTNGNLKPAFLSRGLMRHAAIMAARLRRASEASQLGTHSRRLAVTEALGAVAGALRYYRAARRQGIGEDVEPIQVNTQDGVN